MSLVKIIKEFIYKCDFFFSAELLRYNGETENKTLFGGFVSIGLITALLITFASMVLDTLDMIKITSGVNFKNADDPTPLTLTTIGNGTGKFMFGV